MSADSKAFETVNSLPGLTAEERQYLLTVSRGEGFYGLGWGNPNPETISLSERFGIDPRAGVGSNNWGAEQGTGSAGSFPHIDKHRDHTPYVGQYKKHHTPEEGAASVARVLLKPNVRAALALGDIKAAVKAQQANGYFELAFEEYLSAVKRNYDALTQSLKWPTLLQVKETIAESPLDPSSGLGLSLPPDTSSGKPSLRLGSSDHGNAEGPVHLLQTLLNQHKSALRVDGEFGRFTRGAVLLFQTKNHLKIDGIVGPVTWSRLNVA